MSVANYPTWEEFIATSFAARHEWPLVAPETPSFMARDIARGPEDLEGADVVVIGAPYVAASRGLYAGVPMEDWIEAPKRVRQQSARYPSGYIQDFDLDVFEHLRMVDYGDADIPERVMHEQTAENVLAAQAAVGVGERSPDDALDLVVGKRLKRQHTGARQQRGDHLERWVLGRCPDEDDRSVLDVGEDGVLLGLVEAVHLVDEEDGAEVLGGAYLAGLLDRLPEVGDAGGDGGDADEVRFRESGDEARERRLAGAGRAPEHHGGHLAGADGALQHVALAEEVALSDVLLERTGAHAGRERGVLVLVLSPHVFEERLFLPHAALCHGTLTLTLSPQGRGDHTPPSYPSGARSCAR